MEATGAGEVGAGMGIVTVALAILAVLAIVGGLVGFFRAKENAERALTRRIENEKLAHDAMIRQEERRSAYAGRIVVRPPGSRIGVSVRNRKVE